MDGLPISNSSNFFTKLASVYRDGGEVNDSSICTLLGKYSSPTFKLSKTENDCSSPSSCKL